MNTDLCLIGRGPSIGMLDWTAIEDMDWAAISSGITVVPWSPSHWVAVDGAEHFPWQWVHSSRLSRHVPDDQEGWPADCTRWQCNHEPDPNFSDDGPLSDGALAMRARMRSEFGGIFHNSALLAVQVAHRLGYERIHFAGCDFTDELLLPIVDVLEEWHVHAQRCGFEWCNMSPLSHLQRFLPSSERMMLI